MKWDRYISLGILFLGLYFGISKSAEDKKTKCDPTATTNTTQIKEMALSGGH